MNKKHDKKPDYSLVYWYTDLESHKCGYCKDNTGSISHGMWAEALTVEDYQNLIDRGWRRSGHYCYKPVMDRICCPAYTIRCNANDLVLTKSQKKVVKRFNRFVNEGGELRKAGEGGGSHDESMSCVEVVPREFKGGGGFDVAAFTEALENEEEDAATSEKPVKLPQEPATSIIVENELPNRTAVQNESIMDREAASTSQPKSGIGADPSRPPCKKAKVMRLERKQEKLLKRGMSLEKIDKTGKEQKSLEDFLDGISENSKHKFRLQLVCTSRLGDDWDRVKHIEFELYKKYQVVIHGDPPHKPTMEGFKRFLVKTPLEITLERLHENHKYFQLTADLYRKYQTVIHDDTVEECEPGQYAQFLLKSPLQYVPFPNVSGSVLGYGSFHQLYWLDDKLIAVGVVDILPKCVSAVYFFYDPDYRSLTLGTYGILRELKLSRSLHAIQPSIQYYYMGFYIHSCPKMRYKGKLTPSFLLCPETYRWCPIQDCTAKLDASKYSRLDPDPEAKDEDACTPEDADEVRMFIQRKIMPYKLYKALSSRDELQEPFAVVSRLVGKKCYKKLIVAHVQ